MTKKYRNHLRLLAALALFCALAYVVTLIFHIKVSFLTFDAKDAVVCIAAMIFGVLPAVAIALVVSTIEAISISDTAFWGWLMNFISTAVFAAVAGIVYRRVRKMWGAILGLCLAVVIFTGVMMAMNLIITPIYMKTTVDVVMGLIPTLLLPFNLIKALLNAALVLAFYKPIVTALRKSKVLPVRELAVETGYRMNAKSVVVLCIAAAVAVGCVLAMVYLMNGSLSFV
jgi:riboflavin transporter FmnP